MAGYKENWSMDDDRETHPTEHNSVARGLNYRRYAHREASLQQAINEAIGGNRPLELDPRKVYTTAEPITLSNLQGFLLEGNWATIKATADLPYLLDLNGIADCDLSRLYLDTADNVVVDSMVRYRWQLDVPRSSTRNNFYRVNVSGNYRKGWHVGDSSRQVDVSEWRFCGCNGGQDWKTQNWSDPDALWRHAWLLGDGAHGNGMLTSFYTCWAFRHHTHWRIDGYRYVYIGPGCNGSFALCDMESNATREVMMNYRGESSEMLFKGNAGGASYPMDMQISGGFHPHDGIALTMPVDGAVIDVNYGGTLIVKNLSCQPLAAGAKLVRSHDLNGDLDVDVTGAKLEGVAPGDAFDLDVRTTLRSFGVRQINAQGGLVA